MKLFIALFFLPLLLLSSCVDEVVLDSEVDATYFYIGSTSDYSYANIQFVIDSVPDEYGYYNITNPYKEFPYGSLTDSLTAYFYFSGSYGINVSYSSDSTVFVQANSFKQLFNKMVFISITSKDNTTSKKYRIIARVKPLNPKEIVWAKYTTPALFANDWYKKGFSFKGKNWVLTGNIDTEAGTVSNSLFSIESGEFVAHTLPSEFPKGIDHSLVVFQDKLHIYGYVGLDETTKTYMAKQEHWSSEDGLTWIKEDGYPAIGNGVVLSNAIAFNNKLWLYGGSQINEGQTNLELAYYNSRTEVKSVNTTYQLLKDGLSGISLLDDAISIADTTEINEGIAYKCLINRVVRDGVPGASRLLFSSEDGSNFTYEGEIRPDMAVRFAAFLDYNNTFVSSGGELADGTVSDQTIYSEDMSYYIPVSSNTVQRINGAIASYGTYLFMYGGEFERQYLGLLELESGANWMSVPSIRKPYFLESGAGCSIWNDSEAYSLFILGGYKHQAILKDGVMTTKRVSVNYMEEGILNAFID